MAADGAFLDGVATGAGGLPAGTAAAGALGIAAGLDAAVGAGSGFAAGAMGAGFATAGALAIVFAAGAADEAAGGFAAATVFALLGVDFVAVVSVGDVAEALPEAASALAAFLEDFFVDWVSVAATPEAADEVVVSFDLAAEGFFVEEVSALVADEAAAEAVSAFFFLEDLDVDVSEGVAEVSGASPVGFLDFFAFLVDVEDDCSLAGLVWDWAQLIVTHNRERQIVSQNAGCTNLFFMGNLLSHLEARQIGIASEEGGRRSFPSNRADAHS